METTFWKAVKHHFGVDREEVRDECREPRLVRVRGCISWTLGELGWKGEAIANLLNKVPSSVTQGRRRIEKELKGNGELKATLQLFTAAIAPECKECGQRRPVKAGPR